MDNIDETKTDCLHFNGYKPCLPHKQDGLHCRDCKSYQPSGIRILIIKLQASGEVIRNTPLLVRLEKEFPDAKIFWLTLYPELLPKQEIYKVLKFGADSSLILKDIEFDLLLSLDKDLEACALANQIRSKVKKGFSQRDGVIIPFDSDAKRKWLTGIFDDLMKENTKHYVEEIFEICGFQYDGEPYILPEYKIPKVDLDTSKRVIALNTGVGPLWKPRLYSPEKWSDLARLLMGKGYEVFLAGGPNEDERNRAIAENSGAKYFGTFQYPEFIGLLSLSEAVVTSVTFALHVAVGLQKKIVLLNNTFNPHEFHLFGKGVVLEPNVPCTMCYKPNFDDNCHQHQCMDLIPAEEIEKHLGQLLC